MINQASNIRTTGGGVSKSQTSSTTELCLLNIARLFRILTLRNPSTESTMVEITPPEILSLPHNSNNAQTLEKPFECFGTTSGGVRTIGRSRFQNFLRGRLLACYAGVLRRKKSLLGSRALTPVFDLANVGPKHRFSTAQFVVSNCLALGYGAGFEKFITMSSIYTGLDLTADDPEWLDEEKTLPGWGKRAKEIVADFRARNPKITELWNKLDMAFKRSTGSDLRVALPSGRVLNYCKVKGEKRIKPGKDGKPFLSAVFTCDIGGRRFENYGGKLTENLVQATARDVMADGMLRVEEAGHKVLFSVHDELIVECQPGTKPEEIARIMSITPSWCPGLPLAAEAKLVEHYEK